MEGIKKVYYDRDNNVEVHCYNGLVDYYFVNEENGKFKHYRIKTNNFYSINTLVDFWAKNNLKVNDLDVINQVSKNCLRCDFNDALKLMPTCVVDKLDIEKIALDLYAPRLGLAQLSEEKVEMAARAFFNYLDYVNNERFNKLVDYNLFIEEFINDDLYEKLNLKEDYENLVSFSENNELSREIGKYKVIIVNAKKKTETENIYNKKLLKLKIEKIKREKEREK